MNYLKHVLCRSHLQNRTGGTYHRRTKHGSFPQIPEIHISKETFFITYAKLDSLHTIRVFEYLMVVTQSNERHACMYIWQTHTEKSICRCPPRCMQLFSSCEFRNDNSFVILYLTRFLLVNNARFASQGRTTFPRSKRFHGYKNADVSLNAGRRISIISALELLFLLPENGKIV